jgi:hypothetical protein
MALNVKGDRPGGKHRHGRQQIFDMQMPPSMQQRRDLSGPKHLPSRRLGRIRLNEGMLQAFLQHFRHDAAARRPFAILVKRRSHQTLTSSRH